MFVATLIADPARAGLDRATVEALRDAWGGRTVRWLAPGAAAEFDVAAVPAEAWDHWQALQGIGVDLCWQPAEGREKRLLLADMDSTMIGQECIDELAALAGVGPQVAAITARSMAGELDFESALRERVALLEGLPETAVAEVLATRITYTPGGATLIATMRARGAWTALVSGGFTAFSGPVAAHLGFDEHRANTLLVADGRLTGRVAEPILGRTAKAEALADLCARLGIEPAQAMAVGDGANDLAMLAAAGAGVALHAKPAVQAAARLRINHGDLTALLYLQGIPAADFA
jgi:phosphoserine phosphatase